MKLNLHSRFLLLFGTIFDLGGAAGYPFFVWYAEVILPRLFENDASSVRPDGSMQVLSVV